MGKSKRALADEAYLRVNTPDNNGALPGQLTIEGAIAASEALSPTEEPEPIDGIPVKCPSCGAPQPVLHGWAYSKFGPPTIQCGKCSKRYAVTEEQHAKYRAQVQNAYALLVKSKTTPPVPQKTRRNRGAR